MKSLRRAVIGFLVLSAGVASAAGTPPPAAPTPLGRSGRQTPPVPAVPPVPATESDDEQLIEKSVPARPDAWIILHNPNGSIRLTGWTRPEVSIRCTLDRNASRLRASGLDDSSEIRIEVEPRADRLGWAREFLKLSDPKSRGVDPAGRKKKEQERMRAKIQAEVDRSLRAAQRAAERAGHARSAGEEAEVDALSGPGAVEAELEVFVPRMSRLTVETFDADLSTSGLTGTVDVSSLGGDMQLEGQFRRIDAECVTCDIQAGATSEAFKASTVSGDITMQLAQGYVELNTVSGDVVLTGQNVSQGSFTSVSGNLLFSGDVSRGGALFFETHDGSIDLQLPRRLAAEFDLRSVTGAISSNLENRRSEPPGSFSGRQFRFVTGQGGVRISAKSFAGDITVEAEEH